jgi:hypothetical protein
VIYKSERRRRHRHPHRRHPPSGIRCRPLPTHMPPPLPPWCPSSSSSCCTQRPRCTWECRRRRRHRRHRRHTFATATTAVVAVVVVVVLHTAASLHVGVCPARPHGCRGGAPCQEGQVRRPFNSKLVGRPRRLPRSRGWR